LYINGSPENIFSKLGSESALRTHILSSIATRYVKSREELKEFMNHTFYAMHSSLWGIETTIDKVIETLTENEMISEKEGKFHPTLFGERVSDLYIDPLSAIYMRKAIAAAKPDSPSFGLLHAACAAPDMMKLYLRKGDTWIEDVVLNAKFLLPVPDDGTVEYEWFTAEVKTASLIWDWINGEKEEAIEDKYSVGPGDIRNKVEIAQWLLYSMGELARIFKPEMVAPIAKITKRVKYGVKDELLPLIDMDGVGRIRALKLFSAGFKTPEEIAKADLLQLSDIVGIGPVLARKLKNQTRLESEKFRF
jgi:helicase